MAGGFEAIPICTLQLTAALLFWICSAVINLLLNNAEKLLFCWHTFDEQSQFAFPVAALILELNALNGKQQPWETLVVT